MFKALLTLSAGIILSANTALAGNVYSNRLDLPEVKTQSETQRVSHAENNIKAALRVGSDRLDLPKTVNLGSSRTRTNDQASKSNAYVISNRQDLTGIRN